VSRGAGGSGGGSPPKAGAGRRVLGWIRTGLRAIRGHRGAVLAAMIACFLVLFGLHLIHLYYYHYEFVRIEKLDFNDEHNLPTAFASCQLLLASYLLFHIARLPGTARRKSWYALAVVFLIIAVDEWGMLHDGLTEDFRHLADEYQSLAWIRDHDFLHFAWVVPYSLLLAVFTAVFLPFYLHLPAKFKWLFAISGTVYVLGALGFEMLGAPINKLEGRRSPAYSTVTTIEESLEFVGMMIFAWTLLTWIRGHPPHPTGDAEDAEEAGSEVRPATATGERDGR